MKLPIWRWLRRPLTLIEQKREAWSGPIAYRYTQPVETRKQWKTVARFKRKAS